MVKKAPGFVAGSVAFDYQLHLGLPMVQCPENHLVLLRRMNATSKPESEIAKMKAKAVELLSALLADAARSVKMRGLDEFLCKSPDDATLRFHLAGELRDEAKVERAGGALRRCESPRGSRRR